MGGKVFKIQRSGGTVNHGQAEQQQGAGEEGGKNILGSCFGRVVTVFVEGNQGSHRDGCRFQPDEEHQEVSGGNHEIHTKQSGECQYIKFSLFERGIFTFHPFVVPSGRQSVYLRSELT